MKWAETRGKETCHESLEDSAYKGIRYAGYCLFISICSCGKDAEYDKEQKSILAD